jgi:hypothetical protein
LQFAFCAPFCATHPNPLPFAAAAMAAALLLSMYFTIKGQHPAEWHRAFYEIFLTPTLGPIGADKRGAGNTTWPWKKKSKAQQCQRPVVFSNI